MNEGTASERTQDTIKLNEEDRLVAELHWQISTAIEDPAQRADAIQAAIATIRELALRDAQALVKAMAEQGRWGGRVR
jgi:hypothetical protein